MSNAAVLGLNVPTQVAPGQNFSASVTLQNTGSDTWVPAALPSSPSGYKLGSYPHDNVAWGESRAMLPASVLPGGQVAVAIQAVAPATPGTYQFQWQMIQEGVAWFGSIATASIVVAGPPPPPPAPASLAAVLTPARPDPSDPSGGVIPGAAGGTVPYFYDSGVYPADGQKRTKDFVNDTGGRLRIVQSFLWTGVVIHGVCDTAVTLSTVDADGNERMINTIPWDHYAEPTTFQGRFLDHHTPIVVEAGEIVRVSHFAANVAGGTSVQHAANILVLRG